LYPDPRMITESSLFYIVISSPLHKNAESVTVQRRRQNALASWDTGFTQDVTVVTSTEGYTSSHCVMKGVWEVVYCLTAQDNDNGTGAFGPLLTCWDIFFYMTYISFSHPQITWRVERPIMFFRYFIYEITVQSPRLCFSFPNHFSFFSSLRISGPMGFSGTHR